MRALIQRVKQASVSVNNELISCIDQGLLVLLGITHADTESQAQKMANKLLKLRIFEDQSGKMNLSVRDVSGSLLVVSQFTLYADTRKGNRPSYTQAAEPIVAENLYNYFLQYLQKNYQAPIKCGLFGANMQVNLTNDGPVTIFLEQ